MKVMTVAGTRPEIIRLSAVIRRLESTPGIEHVLVHTGQNWDPSLKDIFFSDLNLKLPDIELGVDTRTLGTTLGGILAGTEEAIQAEQPDAFLVLGDTNSALSLIMAKRMHVPTFHMEAGNRCFDNNVPEETNRRLIDHTSDFNLVYTEHARRNLLAEGLHPRCVVLTGSPMREVLEHHRNRIESSSVLSQVAVADGEFFLVSAHREETVDNPARLQSLLKSLNAVAEHWGLPVLVSTHPRTRKRLELMAPATTNELVTFCEPFGFLDYNRLQLSAKCVLSDSGTISEEASILGFPAVTLRSSIERPEALDTGFITLVDVDPETVVRGVQFVLAREGQCEVPEDYRVTNTSERVVNFILSAVPQHQHWFGLRS